jgi:catechol 2,3-dioxygenase-like lactoylglutathione lyase family enzyme
VKRLDHTVLRVTDKKASARFYEQILGFVHEGEVGPFEVLRINEHFTLDLVQREPAESIHLAFAMEPAEFDDVKTRLVNHGVPFGNSPHGRSNPNPAPAVGARGEAAALYFDDPDGHILEIRNYDPAAVSLAKAN